MFLLLEGFAVWAAEPAGPGEEPRPLCLRNPKFSFTSFLSLYCKKKLKTNHKISNVIKCNELFLLDAEDPPGVRVRVQQVVLVKKRRKEGVGQGERFS